MKDSRLKMLNKLGAENRLAVAKGWGLVKRTQKGRSYEGIIESDGSVLCFHYGGGYITVCICQKL